MSKHQNFECIYRMKNAKTCTQLEAEQTGM